MKKKILRRIQAENLVSVRSLRYIKYSTGERQSGGLLSLPHLLALVKSDVVFAAKPFATCSAVNILTGAGIEYEVLGILSNSEFK